MPARLRCYAWLPRNVPPRFPDRCIRCFEPRPDRHVTLWVTSSPMLAWVVPIALLFSKVTRVRMPACRRCAWKMRFRRMGSVAAMLALVTLAFGLVHALGKDWHRLLRRLGSAVAAIAFLIPFWLLEMRFPPPLILTIEEERLKYEFDLFEFAYEFRELNGVSGQE